MMVSNHRVDLDTAQEPTPGLERAEQEECGRGRDCRVDAVLDAAEDGNEHTGEENNDFQWGDLPELVDSVGWCNKITDGVDDDGSERGIGDVEEDGRERINCEKDDYGSNDTSERCADASLGLDGCSREGAGSRVCTEERSEEVGHTNSHKFLGRVNCVVVDPAKRLGDGDVLNQQHNDGRRNVACECLDDGNVDLWNRSMLESSGHLAQDGELGLQPMVSVDKPADHGVQKDDEGGAQGGDEEPHLLLSGLLLGHCSAGIADEVEQGQSGKAHGCVEIGLAEVLQGVDDHFVGGLARVESCNAHHSWHLTGGNIDG